MISFGMVKAIPFSSANALLVRESYFRIFAVEKSTCGGRKPSFQDT
jgi:hypothetical protein